MLLHVHRSHKAYYGRAKVGEEGDYIPMVHCHHQTDSCIKMGSDESHFNASLIVRDKITRQYLQTKTFVKRKKSQCVLTSLMCLLLFFSLMSLLLLLV